MGRQSGPFSQNFGGSCQTSSDLINVQIVRVVGAIVVCPEYIFVVVIASVDAGLAFGEGIKQIAIPPRASDILGRTPSLGTDQLWIDNALLCRSLLADPDFMFPTVTVVVGI